MKKSIMLLSLLALVLFIQNVSANFVCGKINNAPDMSSSWYDVFIYFDENPNNYANCKVSPASNKFCCDSNEIKDSSPEVGKKINSAVFDQSGYIAGPSSLIISEEGFDVFPEMQLEKAIKINGLKKLYLNVSEVRFDLSFSENLRNISYILKHNGNQSEKNVCYNCLDYNEILDNLDYGVYELYVKGQSKLFDLEIVENINFSNVETIEFKRSVVCEKCKKLFVPLNSVIKMNISLESSHEIYGDFIDYVPNEWEIINEDDVETYSDTHNSVKWRVHGQNIEKTYLVKSPDLFFPRRYYFQSGFEDFKNIEEKVTVFKFFRLPFLFLQEQYDQNSILKKQGLERYFKISPKNALVINKNNTLNQIAIFPKKELNNVYVHINENPKNKLKDADLNYKIDSNIQNKDIDRILIRLKISKNSPEKNNLFYFDLQSKNWKRAETQKFKEDSSYNYFESYLNNTNLIAIKN